MVANELHSRRHKVTVVTKDVQSTITRDPVRLASSSKLSNGEDHNISDDDLNELYAQELEGELISTLVELHTNFIAP